MTSSTVVVSHQSISTCSESGAPPELDEGDTGLLGDDGVPEGAETVGSGVGWLVVRSVEPLPDAVETEAAAASIDVDEFPPVVPISLARGAWLEVELFVVRELRGEGQERGSVQFLGTPIIHSTNVGLSRRREVGVGGEDALPGVAVTRPWWEWSRPTASSDAGPDMLLFLFGACGLVDGVGQFSTSPANAGLIAAPGDGLWFDRVVALASGVGQLPACPARTRPWRSPS